MRVCCCGLHCCLLETLFASQRRKCCGFGVGFCVVFYNVWNCYISWFFPDSVTFFMLFLLLLFFGYGFCSCSLFIWLTGWLRCLLYLFSVLILHFNCLLFLFVYVVVIVLIIVFVVAVCLFGSLVGCAVCFNCFRYLFYCYTLTVCLFFSLCRYYCFDYRFCSCCLFIWFTGWLRCLL